MSRLNDIEKLRGWCHKILPLVYDDSLSYYEVLCKVRAKINEVIDLTAEQNDIIEEMVQEIANWESTTDEKYDEFVQLMDGKFDTFTSTVNQNFENYEEQINQEIDDFESHINQEFDDFVHLFVDEFDRMHSYTVGDYVEENDEIYKCEALPSPMHSVPIEFNEYTWLRITQGVISRFSHEMMTMQNNIYDFADRMVPIFSEEEYYNKDTVVRRPTLTQTQFPYEFYIAKELITPGTWDATKWERANTFSQAIADVLGINKYEMQEQFDQFLEDYQRQFGVVQSKGTSTTDVMSQKAVSDELQEVDDTFDDIESGQTVVGHASVADNLTPYSEDSGAIQDAPFISQETGTANNTVIVTTGDQAKQLEKLGNAVVYNQMLPVSPVDISETKNGVTLTDNRDGTYTISTDANGATAVTDFSVGSGVWAYNTRLLLGCPNGGSPSSYFMFDAWNSGIYDYGDGKIYQATSANFDIRIRVTSGTVITTPVVFKPRLIGLTQWFNGNENIPDNLLDNPSHFSWYYNGELTYNAGAIEHGEGVKLVCTRGRNLFNKSTAVVGYLNQDGTIDSTQTAYRTSDFILVTPNVSYWLNATYSIRGKQYDKNKHPLNTTDWDVGASSGDRTFNTAPNCVYVRFSYTLAYEDSQCLTPYYTEQQGGEGYGESYPYEEPDIIDTGSEQLGAFDKKPPSGVIERATVTDIFDGTENWLERTTGTYKYFALQVGSVGSVETGKIISVKYPQTSISQTNNNIGINITNSTAYDGAFINIRPSDFETATLESFKASLASNPLTVLYATTTPTTEQGTSFRQYANINDYGIMYWLDSNDELVSIPQGCKIQYPVNYKGFIDDAYMYTNGDATAIALKDDITDSALNARGYYKMQDLLTAFGANGMVGGALRQTLANAKSLDFNNTGCIDLGSFTYTQQSGVNGLWTTTSDIADIKSIASTSELAKAISTYYKTVSANDVYTQTTGIAVRNKLLWIYDNTVATGAELRTKLTGVLFAYEKE